MSSFAGRTPRLMLTVKNEFLGLSFPSSGAAAGVVDTGFDGFLAVPGFAFSELGMDQMQSTTTDGVTADGRRIELRSCMGCVTLLGTRKTHDGPVVTGPGIREILVGTGLLRTLRLKLDYCTGTFGVEECG